MRISIFGLGYVGAVTTACLAARGHQVIGVDVILSKVESIIQGRSPIVEPGLDELIAELVQTGRLAATTDFDRAVAVSDLALICVGTPSSDKGGLETHYVERVATQIGAALRNRSTPFLIVLRSTVLPGTTRSRIGPILEQETGRALGEGYDLLFHPEFLREGSSLYDFSHPAAIVVGEARPGAAKPLLDLYEGIEAPRFVTSLEAAEMIKYANNAFHAIKITFANEIGQLCQSVGVDSRELMHMFCTDTQLNVSSAYLRPGFAFGGSCLPKDLRALMYYARHHDLGLPLLESVLPSNHEQIERVFQRIVQYHPAKIGLIGLAFKPHTDDLRESPLVMLAERLLGKGYSLTIYDAHVQAARLVGKNRAYIEQHMPHLSRLLAPALSDLGDSDLLVLGHPLPDPTWLEHWLASGKRAIDLTGGQPMPITSGYDGLYW
ncbi:MAG: nucleotide sugar dehydrogenase [Chloroflexales bacterium]|nr:nucleotide sugar dehydrogenase [Chloroflexales bacterium]